MKAKYWLILIVAGAGLACWYFSHIFLYIIIAGILSLVGQPIDRFYSKYIRIGKFQSSPSLSAGLALLTLFGIFLLLGMIFFPLIAEEARLLSQLNPRDVWLSLQSQFADFQTLLDQMKFTMNGVRPDIYLQEKLTSLLTFTNVSVMLNELISALGDFFIAVFAICFLTFFFLRDEDQIIRSVLSLLPSEYYERSRRVWQESEVMLKRYFIGVLIEVCLVTAFLWLGLYLAGFKHAILIALFAGLMNIIPYVGPLIGAGFAVLIGATTGTGELMPVLIKVAIVFPIVNLSDAFFLQPLIYSSSVKAHPLEIFLVILTGAALGGIGGMVMAVPTYTVLRVVAREIHAGRNRPASGTP